ncbi:MAG: hypothetical protein P9M14_03865 [Candidatus Alcyoniella australis]|nr:hypothetical protein [Candidatus Alcyoniella australis]
MYGIEAQPLYRKVANAVFVLVLLAIFSLTAFSCSAEKRSYEKAQQANTIEAFESFLAEYPQSAHTENVRRRIGILIINEASKNLVIEEPLGESGEKAVASMGQGLSIRSGNMTWEENGVVFNGEIIFNLADVLPEFIEVTEPTPDGYLVQVNLAPLPQEVPVLVVIKSDPEKGHIASFAPGDGVMGFVAPENWYVRLTAVDLSDSDNGHLVGLEAQVVALKVVGDDIALAVKMPTTPIATEGIEG